MTNFWFTGFKRHSGFNKDLSIKENLRIMYKNTHLKTPEKAFLRVGKQANVLANLSQDKITKQKARAVANIAFRKLSKIKEK